MRRKNENRDKYVRIVEDEYRMEFAHSEGKKFYCYKREEPSNR